jgi:hypothetical protein
MRTLVYLFLALSAQAAVLEFTGFEAGSNTDIYSCTGTYSIQSTVKYSGSYSLRVNPTSSANGNCQFKAWGATGAPVNLVSVPFYVGGRFRADTIPSAGDEPLYEELPSSGNGTYLKLNSAGNIVVYSGATLIATGATAISAATWVYLQFSHATGAGAAYEVRINGVVELSGTATFSTGTPVYSLLGRGDNNGHLIDFYYDDWYFASTVHPTGVTGAVVKVLTPSGAGTYTGFSALFPSSGEAAYQDVNEIPQTSDTTYVQAPSGSVASTYTFAPLGAGTILTVKAITIVKDVTSGASYQMRTRSSSTNTDTTAGDPGTSYVRYSQVFNTDPATGSAWTTGGVNAIEVGPVDANGTNRIRCTAAYAMVLYIPGTSRRHVVVVQ